MEAEATELEQTEQITAEQAEIIISAVSEATARVLGQAHAHLGSTAIAQRLVFLGALKTVAALGKFSGMSEADFAKAARKAYKTIVKLEKIVKEMAPKDVEDISEGES